MVQSAQLLLYFPFLLEYQLVQLVPLAQAVLFHQPVPEIQDCQQNQFLL
jgi:hypothetical protein